MSAGDDRGRAPLAVLMPVYNEAASVGAVVEVVLAQPCVRELIIAGDASTDGTWQALRGFAESDARVRTRTHRQGPRMTIIFKRTGTPRINLGVRHD